MPRCDAREIAERGYVYLTMDRKAKVLLLVVIAAIIAYSVAVDGSENVITRSVSLNSVFTGLLTLAGFLFSARTFITFKLNESVYCKAHYQQMVEKFQEDGAYNSKLYDPLKALDANLGKTCLRCFITLFVVLCFLVFLPKSWQAKPPLWETYGVWHSSKTLAFGDAFTWRNLIYEGATVFVFAVVFAIIVEIYSAVSAVNRNIQSIIAAWENDYETSKKK